MRGLRPLAAEVREAIADPAIRGLPLLGLPDQWSDDVDLLTRADLRIAAVRALYAQSR